MSTPVPPCVTDCILALSAGIAAVVVNLAPGGNDMVAVLGAMLATVIAVIDARKRDCTLPNTISVVIGSSFTGSIVPGIFFYNVWPDLAARFTWHVWAALGFIVGLIGWTFVRACQAALDRRKNAIVETFANRYFPAPPNSAPPPKEPPGVEDDLPMK